VTSAFRVLVVLILLQSLAQQIVMHAQERLLVKFVLEVSVNHSLLVLLAMIIVIMIISVKLINAWYV